MGGPFSYEFRVRYGECDAQGVVFNAHYVAYIDLAITELWRDALGSFERLTTTGVDMVVGHLEIDFRRPARFDDVIRTEARMSRLGTTSMTTDIRILRDDECLAEAQIRHVFLDMATWEKAEIPSWVKDGLAAYS
jgi:acyl-CoA thioester hydrolase